MKKLLITLMAAAAALASLPSAASPEEDRKAMVKFFHDRYPELKEGDFIYGALAFSPDAKAQYESVMDFPPFLVDLDKGEQMWKTPFKNGKTYASCFPNGGKMVAGNYPMFDEKEKKVVTFEMALNACRKANGEEEYKYDDMKTIGVLTAYARSLSDGMKMNVKVETPAAREAYEKGKAFFFQRRGQLNFSCASCHVESAGKVLRTEILSPVLGHTTHWPVFRQGTDLFTIKRRYEGCLKQVRAEPKAIEAEDYNNLEYFHSYLSNGLEMKASVFRK